MTKRLIVEVANNHLGHPRMQATARCPRCGYVLIYDGSRYQCRYCGYYHNLRNRRAIREKFDSLERQLRQGANRLLESPKLRNHADFERVTPAFIKCRACSVSLPLGTNLCPSCGTSQLAIPTNQTWETSPEKKVFDYILTHDGTISISQAMQDLSISHETLGNAIERLKAAGLLKQP